MNLFLSILKYNYDLFSDFKIYQVKHNIILCVKANNIDEVNYFGYWVNKSI